MKKIKISATTGGRRKALAAAPAAGDAKAIAAAQPWESTVDAPENFAEMAKAWKPDEIYDLAMRQYVIAQQAALRSAHEPASPAAQKRALIDALLSKRGITLAQLEAEVYGSKK